MSAEEPGGARFFDERRRERGWADRVVKRQHALGRLVVLDVMTTDPELLGYLRALDRAALWVEEAGEGGGKYRFAWASGYENGAMVRVQGILADAGFKPFSRSGS
jgi:hypothetical protein